MELENKQRSNEEILNSLMKKLDDKIAEIQSKNSENIIYILCPGFEAIRFTVSDFNVKYDNSDEITYNILLSNVTISESKNVTVSEKAIVHFVTKDELISILTTFVKERLNSNVKITVKGSNSIALEAPKKELKEDELEPEISPISYVPDEILDINDYYGGDLLEKEDNISKKSIV